MWIRYHRDSIGRRRAYRFIEAEARWGLIALLTADKMIEDGTAYVHPESNADPLPYVEPKLRNKRGPIGNLFEIRFETQERKVAERAVRAESAKAAVKKVQELQKGTRHELRAIVSVKEWKR